MLIRRWERARQGDGQLVLIMGEPGLGKSARWYHDQDGLGTPLQFAVGGSMKEVGVSAFLATILMNEDRTREIEMREMTGGCLCGKVRYSHHCRGVPLQKLSEANWNCFLGPSWSSKINYLDPGKSQNISRYW